MKIQRQADTFATRLSWGGHEVREPVERKEDPEPIQNDNVRLMQPHESGLEYPVLVRRNPAGDGWDILRSFSRMSW